MMHAKDQRRENASPSTLTLPQSFPTSPVLARNVSPANVHVTKTTEDKSALIMKFLMGFIKFQKGLPLNRDIYFSNHTVESKNGIIMKNKSCYFSFQRKHLVIGIAYIVCSKARPMRENKCYVTIFPCCHICRCTHHGTFYVKKL